MWYEENVLDNDLNEVISYADFFHAFGFSDQDTIFLRTIHDRDRNAFANNKQVVIFLNDQITK